MATRIGIILLGVMGCLVANAAPPLPSAATITSVTLQPVGPPEHRRGDVMVVHKDGKRVALTKSGMATMPKLAADHRTVAFVQLEWTTYRDERRMAFAKILVHRDGKPTLTLQPEKIAEVDWQFRDGGKQLAVASAGMHGMTFFQLFDTESGAVVATANSGTEPRPTWTADLDSR